MTVKLKLCPLIECGDLHWVTKKRLERYDVNVFIGEVV